jgi:hypothetical protein
MAINVLTYDTKILANSLLCTRAILRPLSAQISPTTYTKLISESTQNTQQECTNPGRLVAKATKFCIVGPKICSLSVFFYLHTKHEYQRTCTEQKPSDNSECHRSLPNCGYSGWSVFLVTLRRCLESGGGLQISCQIYKAAGRK